MIEARARAFFSLPEQVRMRKTDCKTEITSRTDTPINGPKYRAPSRLTRRVISIGGIFRARIYADVRACLVVFEQYVVVRLVLLDEVIFKRERSFSVRVII